MADKKPMDLVRIFDGSDIENLESEINEYLKRNPELYIDKMQFSINTGTTPCRKYIVCDFCFREDLKKEEPETNLTEELLKGLIGAVNELTDAVKSLTKK
jgi:hypothetical protein